jgi:hypothetical protein
MMLIRNRTQSISWRVPASLASIIVAVCFAARTAVAAEPIPLAPPPGEVPARSLTETELEKINKTIADKGSEIRLNRETTSQLGVTKGDELLLSRGIGVKDETGDIHEFEPLSGGKGYLLLKLSPQSNAIYWVSKTFVLTAARSRVPGAPSEEIPTAEAQAGANKELVYWAGFAKEQP